MGCRPIGFCVDDPCGVCEAPVKYRCHPDEETPLNNIETGDTATTSNGVRNSWRDQNYRRRNVV
jgi:hypothetical protein